MKISLLIIVSLFSLNGACQQDSILFKKQDLIINKKSTYFNGKELYNAERDLAAVIEQEKTAECPVDYEFYYNPLSLIGNYYSYESGEGGILACGVPGNSLNVQTIDLDNQTATSLANIFSEESILKALKGDSWVRKLMEERKIDYQSINSFDVLLDTINSFGFAKFKSNSFAILDYDKNRGKVSVRFVGVEYMGYNHTRHLQLGLWLEPKESYRKLLQNKIHFTMGDYKSGLEK